MAWTVLRLLSTFSPRTPPKPQPIGSDRDMPVYTLVVALYREAAAVDGLIAALRRLHYPPEKLDIKLVLEPDDRDTRLAIARLRLAAPFEVIIAPDNKPRTKPKALNVALPFARGKFIAIYDAEDRPEPEQLRLALEAFIAGDRRLACVQARLTIDNTSDSWLTRLFTAEYAGLFDVFLPGLAHWRLPLPLGGSSNHFRADVLKKIGEWDPYNVTEDADLGMRLARLGYRTAVIQSTTYEEAPARFRPWLRQRTRWCKGWMQTWLVHMRSPRKLRRELGSLGFLVFQLLVGGTVMASLVHSLFVAKLLFELVQAGTDPDAVAAMAWHAMFLAVGYVVFAGVSLVGLFRRGLLRCAWALMLLPLYWVLLSFAAWRALFQLACDPYRWEKTEHGLARTSRLAEQHQAAITGSSATPQQHRLACASD
jgi:cellulose synthase/poly-beta-1,6-N-acetylglucosamine synthase-like glycosyltransferase